MAFTHFRLSISHQCRQKHTNKVDSQFEKLDQSSNNVVRKHKNKTRTTIDATASSSSKTHPKLIDAHSKGFHAAPRFSVRVASFFFFLCVFLLQQYFVSSYNVSRLRPSCEKIFPQGDFSTVEKSLRRQPGCNRQSRTPTCSDRDP